jgi:hypothetical protein
VVYRGVHRPARRSDGQLPPAVDVAVKVLKSTHPHKAQRLVQEVNMLYRCQETPGVVRLIGVVIQENEYMIVSWGSPHMTSSNVHSLPLRPDGIHSPACLLHRVCVWCLCVVMCR